VLLKIGPYGAYIESGETRSTLPKKIELRTLDFQTALQYLELPRCVISTLSQRFVNGFCQRLFIMAVQNLVTVLCCTNVSYCAALACVAQSAAVLTQHRIVQRL
jgi:Topoisomerase C-terminal repeat